MARHDALRMLRRKYFAGGTVDLVSVQRELRPLLQKSGASIIAELTTEYSVNNFPQLPVRENANVFVWFMVFKDGAAFDMQRRALLNSPEWRELVGKLSLGTYQPIETLRLQPTARSRLHIG